MLFRNAQPTDYDVEQKITALRAWMCLMEIAQKHNKSLVKTRSCMPIYRKKRPSLSYEETWAGMAVESLPSELGKFIRKKQIQELLHQSFHKTMDRRCQTAGACITLAIISAALTFSKVSLNIAKAHIGAPFLFGAPTVFLMIIALIVLSKRNECVVALDPSRCQSTLAELAKLLKVRTAALPKDLLTFEQTAKTHGLPFSRAEMRIAESKLSLTPPAPENRSNRRIMPASSAAA